MLRSCAGHFLTFSKICSPNLPLLYFIDNYISQAALVN